MSRHIDIQHALDAFTALAQPTRLDVFRRLLKVHPDEIAAGEIARACDVPHNTMSTHLAVLSRAGLIGMRRDGRIIYCGASLEGLRALVGFLMRDCCHGRAEICAPLITELTGCVPAKTRKRVHA